MTGWGWPRPRLRAPSSCRPPGPRSCQLARCPRTTAPPFRRPLWPSWRAGFAPIPTKSGASKASRLILGSWERRRPGPASAASRSLQKTTCHEPTCSSSGGRAGELDDQGPAHRGQRRTRRPGPASAASRSLQKIVGAIVGAASRTGREHLQGSSPPDVHREGFRAIDTRPRTAWRSTRAARSVSRRRR